MTTKTKQYSWKEIGFMLLPEDKKDAIYKKREQDKKRREDKSQQLRIKNLKLTPYEKETFEEYKRLEFSLKCRREKDEMDDYYFELSDKCSKLFQEIVEYLRANYNSYILQETIWEQASKDLWYDIKKAVYATDSNYKDRLAYSDWRVTKGKKLLKERDSIDQKYSDLFKFVFQNGEKK